MAQFDGYSKFMVYDNGYMYVGIMNNNSMYIHAELQPDYWHISQTAENKSMKKRIAFFIKYLKETDYQNKSIAFNHESVLNSMSIRPRSPARFKLITRGYDAERTHPVDVSIFSYKNNTYVLTIQDYQTMLQENWEYPYSFVTKRTVKNKSMGAMIKLLCNIESIMHVHVTGVKVGNFLYDISKC